MFRRMLLRPFLMVLMAAVPLAAAETPLDALPKSAGVLVRLKAPDATFGKLAEFVGQVDPGTGQLVRGLQPAVGVLISNPTLAGVDATKDWWLAVIPHAEQPPAVIYAIPADDADAMQEAIGEGWEFIPHGEWLLYTESADAADAVREQIETKGPSLADVIGKESLAVFTAGDLSAFVNVPHLRETYKAQWEQLENELPKLIEAMSQAAAQSPGANPEAVAEVYRSMFQGLFQAAQDTEGFTAAVAVTKDALTVEEYLTVAADSPTAQILQRHQPSELTLLDRLPAGKLGYFGLHVDMQALMKWSADISGAVYAGDPEAKKAYEQIMKEMAGIHYGGMAYAVELAELDGGALRASVLQEVEPVDKIRQLTRTSMDLMDQLKTPGVETEVELKADAEKYGPHSADVIRIRQEFDETADPTGMLRRIFGALFGEDGMTQRVVYLDEMTAMTLGGGEAAMKELLKSLEQSEVDTERGPLDDTREHLTDKANLVVLFDLPRVAADALRLAAEQPEFPLPIDADALDDVEREPSYLGFSVVTEPHALRAKTYVPIEQIEGIAELVRAVQKQFQQ